MYNWFKLPIPWYESKMAAGSLTQLLFQALVGVELVRECTLDRRSNRPFDPGNLLIRAWMPSLKHEAMFFVVFVVHLTSQHQDV